MPTTGHPSADIAVLSTSENPADNLATILNDLAGPASAEATPATTPRVDINQENVGKGLAQLVLTVVRLVHELLEKQAIRRMDAGSLTDEEVDRLGRTLKAQSDEIRAMAERFGLDESDLNLDLGPLGKAL